jgi:carbamoyltransferase
MNILGISSDFHDSSAALVQDGKPIVTAAEERFSFQKHDPSFPLLALKSCLKSAAVTTDQIDYVAYHEEPAVKFSRLMASRIQNFPRGVNAFCRDIREMALGQLWVKMDIAQATGIAIDRIVNIPHHESHAGYAFVSSGLSDSAILVVDAVGEWASTSIYHGTIENGRTRLELKDSISYPHSLGMLYSAFTAFLGFKVNDSECSTMALAAFGKPTYVEKIRAICRQQNSGLYDIDQTYFDFSDPNRLPLTKKFYSVFGEPRRGSASLPLDTQMNLAAVEALSADHLRYADIAASLQIVLEETVRRLALRAQSLTGSVNLCVAGGVALNCKMIGKMVSEGKFQNIFVPPDPGDGGGALGAAMCLAARIEPTPPARRKISPYLGIAYDETESVETVIDLSSEDGIKAQKLDSSDINEHVISLLEKGCAVGWFQGQFENGPRALGNRSILVDPRNRAAAHRLSTKIKRRAAFRPYACSLREIDSKKVFDFPTDEVPMAARWMSSAYKVRPEAAKDAICALHFDGTTRPQILAAGENPRFEALLADWQQKTGVPTLLNTSFNPAGFPLVSTPMDAILMFLRSDLDGLVLNNTLITKDR